LFSRARHGLWHGVQALGLGQGDTVLTPAYHHGSEIEALQRAGVDCRFYEVNDDLQPPDEDRLAELLGKDVKALYLVHYFGFPQMAERWRRWCDRHGLLLIEDAAMALLSTWKGQPVGSFGHLAIFCVYKTFALPDGGAVVCSASLPEPRGVRPPLGLKSSLMRTGSWLAQRSSLFSTAHGLVGGHRQQLWGQDFDLGDPFSPASRMTSVILRRLADPEAAARRRSNYQFLSEELGDRLRPLFPDVPEGSSPVAFMIRLDPAEQAEVRKELGKHGVRLANFWMVPHPSLPEEGFERTRTLRLSVAGLPVHQELRPTDLRLIVTSVRAATRSPA
jgi:dTDP-4-amino-4,6-dideoxygalactose transaminase